MKTLTWVTGGVVVVVGVSLALLNFQGSTGAADPPKADPAKADPAKADAPKADAPKADPAKGDEQGVLKAMKAYETAFNKADFEGLMALWASDAEFISDQGKATRGRDAIGALMKHSFTEHKGLAIKLTNKAIRFIKPDVALQDAVVTMRAQDMPADSSPYVVVWTKIDDKWLLASARDLPEETLVGATNYSVLKQFEWLVGEWTGEEKDTSVAMSIRWDKNQNFLVIEQAIKMKGDNDISLTQIIGWDPNDQQIRSWVFDSNGGFGEAYWTRQGNQWDLQVAGVLADGRPTSSINVWKYVDDHTLEWQSTQREVDSEPMPDVKMKYIKKETKKDTQK